MEAEAKYDFEASQPDELSFSRGSCLYVTSKEEDGDWYKAFCGTNSGFVPATYIEMKPHDWYKETFGRNKAEQLLLTKSATNDFVYPNGAFIIRKSESDGTGFALSVRYGPSVQHFKILKDARSKFYIWPNVTFDSLNELVQTYSEQSVSGDHGKEIILREISQEVCQALYNFAPANEEELQLNKGDLIKVLAKSDQNWWEGEVNGRRGYFPVNYVKHVA